MKEGMPMNRAQRLERLVRLQAPCDLLQHEVRMALQEQMVHDIEVGVTGGISWVTAAWSLVASLTIAIDERDQLRRQLKRLKRESNKKAAT